MAFQTRSLWMASLGVVDDDPVSDLQPTLANGMHLRWAFAPVVGFPWHGYYLFRRRSRRGGRVCLSQFSSLLMGGIGATEVGLPIGELRSDQPIALTDDFPPPVVREVDLDGRDHLRFTLPPGEPARRAELTIGFRGNEQSRTTIEVQALVDGVPVVVRRVAGSGGEVASTTFDFDAITAIDLSGGSAALIDICVVPVTAGLTEGWQPLAGFPYPLCLPVAHDDYPGVPPLANEAAARAVALGRISYGPSLRWGPRFAPLHDELIRLVDGGPPPAGEAMVDRFSDVPGTPPPPDESGGQVMQLRQRPLELVLLGSLHPAVAQMLGLYWLDATAIPNAAYDYLLLADHDGSLGGTAASALAWLAAPDWSSVDGFVAFDKTVSAAPPLATPQRLRAYALPGTTLAVDGGEEILDATNNAGLTWDREQTGAVLRPGAPVLYHLWRASFGNAEVPAPLISGDYEVITPGAPVLVGGREAPDDFTTTGGPEHPTHWPPFSVDYIDRARPDGWYAYRVSGIDIFGRHSAMSRDAEWRQWAPMPEPRPWYYLDPPGGQVVHDRRIRLLDKVPPPAPTGVEAFALDPADPTVLRDAAHEAWWESLTPAEQDSVVGLRVRWRWTEAQMRQAPDTREFRVYLQPAPVNGVSGRVAAVTSAGATVSMVDTDIVHTHPAHTFDGLSVRIGTESFRVLESDSSSPLRLRVANIGPVDEIRPQDGARCSVAIPPGHDLHVDFAEAPRWKDRVLVSAFDANVTVELGGALRRYEAFLPVPRSQDRSGLPLTTSLAEPMAYALVGVTAANDRPHTPDHRGDPDRFGNESDVGGPATVFRVRQERPPAPPVPPDSDRVLASPADYHGHSFFTYRWVPSADLRTHVYRALDDAVFAADLALRPRPALSAGDASAFPPQAVDPRWDDAKRTQVATEVNQLNAFDADERAAAMSVYRALSNDALRILAALPGTDSAFTQITIQPLDADEPDPAAPDGLRWRRVGPDLASDALGAAERAYVDALDGRATNRWFYRSAYVDGVHNVGPLGLSSPPVWFPDVVPPRAPVVTRIRGGDRRVTLTWASNREPDLAEYRVYRTHDRKAARDIRLMETVHTEAMPPGDPHDRPAAVTWVDEPIPGLVNVVYRMVAVDAAGNVSDPSPPVAARAFDEAMPEVPTLTVSWTAVALPAHALLQWESVDETQVERRPTGSPFWAPVGGWRQPGSHEETHPVDASQAWEHRLRVRRSTGAIRVGPPVVLDHL